MILRFVGDRKSENASDPEAVTYYGVRFPKGVFVEMTDPEGIRRLSHSTHFEVGLDDSQPKRGPGRPKKITSEPNHDGDE